jgi:hypothetical protein
MTSLREQLAEHGFVSDQDYEYPVRCLMSAPFDHLRCAHVDGEPGRRKTAFAHALGHALGYAHVLYHELDQETQPAQPVRVPPPADEDEPVGEPPVQALDRVMSEACALSEGERTALVLDQLQLAPFRQHLRLADFIQSGAWSYGEVTLKAHRHNFLLLLVSEEPLFHSIQHRAFRIWVASERADEGPVTPASLGLADNALGLLDALREICDALNVAPSVAEYRRLVHDIHVNVHTVEDLRTSIFGWIEDVEHRHLHSPLMTRVLERHWPAVMAYLGIDDAAPGRIVLDAGEEP